MIIQLSKREFAVGGGACSAFDAMRHWYLVARESFASRPGAVVTGGSRVAFMAGGGPSPVHALLPVDRRRILWLGRVESIPFSSGLHGSVLRCGLTYAL